MGRHIIYSYYLYDFFFYFGRFLILSTLEFVRILLVSLYKDLCYVIVL